MSNDFSTDEEVRAFDAARDQAPNMGANYDRMKGIWVAAREFFSEADRQPVDQVESRVYESEMAARFKALDIAIAGTAGVEPDRREIIAAAEANYGFIIAGILGPTKPVFSQEPLF